MRSAWDHGDERGFLSQRQQPGGMPQAGDQQAGARTAFVSLVGPPEASELRLAVGMSESQERL